MIGGILLGGQGGVTIQMENVGLKALAVVLLGGIDSIVGAVVAGIILGILENIAAGYLDPLLPAGGLASVFPFIVMIIVLVFRPYGLLRPETNREDIEDGLTLRGLSTELRTGYGHHPDEGRNGSFSGYFSCFCSPVLFSSAIRCSPSPSLSASP